jgi:GNAT superfamily N-acetyltransferase
MGSRSLGVAMARDPQHHVRLATAADFAALVPVFQAYMHETYAQPWHGSVEALAADALGQRCSLLVAADPQQSLVGFLAWPSYDLHHCVAGGEVMDLYVQPPSRGRGVALLLGCAAAARIREGGGMYVKGGVVMSGSGSRLYRRFAVCDASGCIVSGRGFRRLAELAGRSVRDVVKQLPEPSWSYEA